MIISLISLISISSCTFLTQSQTKKNTPHKIITYKMNNDNEYNIAKLSEAINYNHLTTETKASLLYQRGLYFDSLGLNILAQIDFRHALNLKLYTPEIFNYIGIYLMQNGDYDAAYESFSSALEIEPNYNYTYFNRAIALFYDKKLDLALLDIETYFQLNPNDPYRVIWYYIIQYQQDLDQATQLLEKNKENFAKNSWEYQLILLLLNEKTENELLHFIDKYGYTNNYKAQMLNELYFYQGQIAKFKKNYTKAVTYFEYTLSISAFEHIEYRYAQMDLHYLKNNVKDKGTHIVHK